MNAYEFRRLCFRSLILVAADALTELSFHEGDLVKQGQLQSWMKSPQGARTLTPATAK